MARGIFSTHKKIGREIERDAKRQQREAEKRQREAERQQAQDHRAIVKYEKFRERAIQQASRAAGAERKRLVANAKAQHKRMAADTKAAHVGAQLASVETLNAQLKETYEAIDGLLAATLNVDDYFDLESLRRQPAHPPFGHAHLVPPTMRSAAILDPVEPISRPPLPSKAVFGRKKKNEAAIAAAQTAFALAQSAWRSKFEAAKERRKSQIAEYERAEKKRIENLERERARYAEECAERERTVAEYNSCIDALIANLGYGTADAIESYIWLVFSESLYPDFFPVSHEFKFAPSTAELQLRVSIPPPSKVDTTKIYRYLKKNDEITSSELSQKAQKDRYTASVHQVALRSIHEVFEADRRALIKTVSLEVGAETTDPATGKVGFIPFAAVAAEREAFLEFDLSAVVPKSTLVHLGAALSKNPLGLIAADSSGVRRA